MFRTITCRLSMTPVHRQIFRQPQNNFLPIITATTISVRLKQYFSGVQGKRNTKLRGKQKDEEGEELDALKEMAKGGEEIKMNDVEYESLASDAMNVTSSIRTEQNVLIIQPFVKWGPKKSATTPDLKMLEAQDLIRSLDTWSIGESIKVPLESLDSKKVFGRGKLEEIRQLIKKHSLSLEKRITCIFVSKSMLTRTQKKNLELIFGLPVLDRFSIVIQILRLHATSREAKLQISMAEIPYIWHQLGNTDQKHHGRLTDSHRLLLRNREKRIKTELEMVRSHRKIIRKNRLERDFPIVAIVGYTNAGKTSLIKALTHEEQIEPKNKLFATLDITAHGGVLPCNLKVIYMDTIGFMADIPTGLIECFVATLEDAMIADIIIHVQDISHPNFFEQRKHVEETLNNLLRDLSDEERKKLMSNIINVGNKCDLVENISDFMATHNTLTDGSSLFEPMHFISSTKSTGLHDLEMSIERNILRVTDRKKIIIRVPNGGHELAWLYKNTAVTHTEADPKSSNFLLVHAILTDLAFLQFKSFFLKRK